MKFNENPASRVEAPERFKERLDTILNRPLTVENINEFGDDALNELIPLVEKVVATYKATQSELPSVQKDIEDSAFKEYQLGDIEYVLEQVHDKIVELKEIDLYIAERVIKIKDVTTPPDTRNDPIQPGDGSYEAPSQIPRLKTLLYILSNDFGIDLDEISTTQGTTTREMVRQTGYVTVEIPELNRAVLLCDEAENATYVFDTTQTTVLHISVEDLDQMTKNEKNELIAQHPTIGRRVLQSSLWREVISESLKDSIKPDQRTMRIASRSEFSQERGRFLPFEEFQSEVQKLYPGEGGIAKWYRAECINHPVWPTQPQKSYKGFGWKNWFDLVGQERVEFLTFEDFRNEVRNLYPGEGGVSAWYEKERENHPNWPVAPYSAYAKSGWEGWPRLVDEDAPERVEFLPFDKFQAEVTALYQGAGNIEKWFKDERINHPRWPFAPSVTYKKTGWQSWPELVGKAALERNPIIPYEEFEIEVRSLYPGEIPFGPWYRDEQKKHKGWPVDPRDVYKNKGWVDTNSLLGIEKTQYLPLERFQEEVRGLYPGEGAVTTWYKEEQPKHADWPERPDVTYQYIGWTGWSGLVGKEAPNAYKAITFDEFFSEVQAVLPEQMNKSVMQWYKEERVRHPHWPSSPDTKYKNEGWESWPSLAGQERKMYSHDLKRATLPGRHEIKQYLPYDQFIESVRSSLPEDETVVPWRWYQEEKLKHPDWPFSPDTKYKDEGWESWPALVGQEKKKYPKYEDLQAEVSQLYPGGSIGVWYRNEYKKHADWPSNPNVIYKGKGWVSFTEFVQGKHEDQK